MIAVAVVRRSRSRMCPGRSRCIVSRACRMVAVAVAVVWRSRTLSHFKLTNQKKTLKTNDLLLRSSTHCYCLVVTT